MNRGALRLVFLAGLGVAVGPLRATELLPGEALSAGRISAGNSSPGILTMQVPTPFFYEGPSSGGLRHFQYYNTFGGQLVEDGQGDTELVYGFAGPVFGEHPTLPGDPTHTVSGLPADAVVSVGGFGTAAVDVSVISNPVREVGVQTIERSADGNVISFTGFSGTATGGMNLLSDGFVFQVAGVTFGPSTAMATLVDAEGQERVLTVDAIGPTPGGGNLPEPATMGLLGAALGGLWVRLGRR
ncbi:MAG TPA: PEP-CTERM sorting domain-containing protein [Phycisphaerae bacterium]|nr:PEP-CTERM sorting domain-containing protein [Phycisphaerae bacterium]